MQKYPALDISVMVVWVSMLVTDKEADHSQREPSLKDARAVHFWDGERHIGRWFKQNVLPSFQDSEVGLPGPLVEGVRSGEVVWDTFLLYGRHARWDPLPGKHISWGFPVVNTVQGLTAEVEKFVRKGP